MKPFICIQFGQGKLWHCWGRDVASVTWRKVAQELVKDDTSVCLGKVGTWSLEQGFSCLGRWAVRNIPALRGFFIKSNCPMGNLMRAKHRTVHHCISSDVVIGARSLSFILTISLYICSSWLVTQSRRISCSKIQNDQQCLIFRGVSRVKLPTGCIRIVAPGMMIFNEKCT